MSQNINSNDAFFDEEIKRIKRLLAQLQPGKVPLSIFSEIARLTVMSVIEVVPFTFEANGNIKVLLLRRDDNDPTWPGMCHVPGGIVLPTDMTEDFRESLARVIAKLGATKISKPVFVQNVFCQVRRGAEVALVYSVAITGEPAVGALYDVQSLPPNMIEGQANFVHIAAAHYKQQNQ